MIRVALNLEDRAVEFDWAYDENFVADVSMRICLERLGSCEPEVTQLMFRVIKPGDWVVDGGANVGFFSMLMSRLVGSTGRVLAFEPGANNIPKLRENIAANKMDNVEIIERALWCHNQDVTLHLCADSGSNSLTKSNDSISEVSVSGVKLSGYGREVRFKLIKLDVEGAEQRVLEGAAAHLGRKVPYIVCELNGPALRRMEDSQMSLRKLMLAYGYDMFVLHADGRLPSLVPVNSLVEATAPNTNVLFSTMLHVGEAWPAVQA